MQIFTLYSSSMPDKYPTLAKFNVTSIKLVETPANTFRVELEHVLHDKKELILSKLFIYNPEHEITPGDLVKCGAEGVLDVIAELIAKREYVKSKRVTRD